MNARDELAAIIDDRWHGYGYNPAGAADAILAAGYTKDAAELAKARRAARTLNEVIEKQCRDVLDVTGLHHLINEDGDGHWDVVWMRLFEMRDELVSLKESTIGAERKRGNSWRDRAQEMQVRLESIELDESIERAARAAYEATLDDDGEAMTWEELSAANPDYPEIWRAQVRAVIEALRGAS